MAPALILIRQNTRWSNLAKFLPLVRARIVSGHLTESDQFFEKCKSFNFSPQVRWKFEPAVLGENLLNMTSVIRIDLRFKIYDATGSTTRSGFQLNYEWALSNLITYNKCRGAGATGAVAPVAETVRGQPRTQALSTTRLAEWKEPGTRLVRGRRGGNRLPFFTRTALRNLCVIHMNRNL
jgi:hypothetical protein